MNGSVWRAAESISCIPNHLPGGPEECEQVELKGFNVSLQVSCALNCMLWKFVNHEGKVFVVQVKYRSLWIRSSTAWAGKLCRVSCDILCLQEEEHLSVTDIQMR